MRYLNSVLAPFDSAVADRWRRCFGLFPVIRDAGSMHLFAPTSAAGKFQGQATRVDGPALGRGYRTDLVMGEPFLQSGVRFGIVKLPCPGMLEGAEGHQRNAVSAVAFGLKQIIAAVYGLRD